MKVFIFGLGHLAEFIAKEFHDFEIFGTYRSKLREPFKNIATFQFDAKDELPQELEGEYDYIIWNLTPSDDYKDLLLRADKFFPANIPWIFISSTGVFSAGEVNEDSLRDTNSARTQRLNELEEIVSSLERRTSILRPAGLVDEKRNPKNFFKNSDSISQANLKINLVHTHDVAKFIRHVIDNNLIGEDYNLCCDEHPTKKDFYGVLTGKETSIDENAQSKIVSNLKAKRAGFVFQNVCDLKMWI